MWCLLCMCYALCYAYTNDRHKAGTPCPPAQWIPLVLPCVASYRSVSDLSKHQTALCWHLKSEPGIFSYLVYPDYIKTPYTQRYLLFFIFPVRSRYTLKLLLFAENACDNDILDAFSYAEDIWFMVGKVAGDNDLSNRKDQWWQLTISPGAYANVHINEDEDDGSYDFFQLF